jgi:hypothetical protein
MLGGAQTTATEVWDATAAMSTYLDERYPVIDLALATYNGAVGVGRNRIAPYTMTDVMSDLYAMRDAAGMDVGTDLRLACVMQLVGKAIKRYQPK